MKLDLTYDEFLEKVDRNHKQFNGSWRYGQTYFNTLSSLRPDLAEKLRATLHDPFHREEVKDETHKFIKQMW